MSFKTGAIKQEQVMHHLSIYTHTPFCWNIVVTSTFSVGPKQKDSEVMKLLSKNLKTIIVKSILSP